MTKRSITDLSYKITGCAITVHRILGPGLLESVYQKCLEYELLSRGFTVNKNLIVPVNYKGITLDADLRIDLLVNNSIILELKAVEAIHPVHEAQLLTYMRLMQKPQGLLINFHTDNLIRELRPYVNECFRELPDE